MFCMGGPMDTYMEEISMVNWEKKKSKSFS